MKKKMKKKKWQEQQNRQVKSAPEQKSKFLVHDTHLFCGYPCCSKYFTNSSKSVSNK